jgi:hypothetical protein
VALAENFCRVMGFMMKELSEFLSTTNEIRDRIETLSTFLKIDNVRHQIDKLEVTMRSPDFWNNQLLAKEMGRKLHALKEKLTNIEDFKR